MANLDMTALLAAEDKYRAAAIEAAAHDPTKSQKLLNTGSKLRDIRTWLTDGKGEGNLSWRDEAVIAEYLYDVSQALGFTPAP